MKTGPLFAWIAVIYSILILAKVISVLVRRERYKFTFWDGGMLLSGKELGTAGTYAFGAMILALGSVGIWLVHAWSKL